jgi:hypothetical protein
MLRPSGLFPFSDGQYLPLQEFRGELLCPGRRAGLSSLFQRKTAFTPRPSSGVPLSVRLLRFQPPPARSVAAVKSYLPPASILKLSYAFDYKSFVHSVRPSQPPGQLIADRYFESRTTVKAGASWGYKYFVHPFLPSAAAVEEPVGGTSGTGMGRAAAAWAGAADVPGGRVPSRSGNSDRLSPG